MFFIITHCRTEFIPLNFQKFYFYYQMFENYFIKQEDYDSQFQIIFFNSAETLVVFFKCGIPILLLKALRHQ